MRFSGQDSSVESRPKELKRASQDDQTNLWLFRMLVGWVEFISIWLLIGIWIQMPNSSLAWPISLNGRNRLRLPITCPYCSPVTCYHWQSNRLKPIGWKCFGWKYFQELADLRAKGFWNRKFFSCSVITDTPAHTADSVTGRCYRDSTFKLKQFCLPSSTKIVRQKSA